MVTQLFPNDITGHALLAYFYGVRNELDNAIAEYKRILEIDPEMHKILQTIGKHYEQKGEFDAVLEYYQRYAERFPDDAKAFMPIGDIYKRMGEYEQSRSYFEKALIFEPDEVSVLLTLGNIEMEMGNFDQAYQQFQNVLETSKTPQDSAQVLDAFEGFHRRRGQMKKSLEYSLLKFQEMQKFNAPFIVMLGQIGALDEHVRAGQKEIALQKLEALRSQLAALYDKFVVLGELKIYQELRDADKAEKAVEGVEHLIKSFGQEQFRLAIFEAQGKIKEIHGEYSKAISNYLNALALNPTRINLTTGIARCYRQLRNYDQAKELLEARLKINPW
ncbi:MAG: tetratricopeptide repeat protein [bacterium]